MSASTTPGLITLHGNQLELLRTAVFDWLRANPLAPLEQEIFLVQSNGVADWLKIALAEELGICAATQVTLPARFLWQSYRRVLGDSRISDASPFDKAPLTWRLMHLLPTLLEQPGFGPLRHFLGEGDAERRLQLARRLADLLDQYQVYRSDWLSDWAAGTDCLRLPSGEASPLAIDQLWQAKLWRAIHASVPAEQRSRGRADIHQAFIDALSGAGNLQGRLPRRLILFGISSLPRQTLQALSALAMHMQVIVAVPNPCRFHWGDIISGRELLTAQHRRLPQRGTTNLADIPFEELHAHAHPLLAAWGRQGRDFIRMLDEFDNSQAADEAAPNLRIDLFSEGMDGSLLVQMQAAIRDMLPLAEHPCNRVGDDDRSVEFHVTHSAQREVEVLHDRLLCMLAEPADMPLRPRDIVVMVPDIDAFSPAIRAVFEQYGERDPRRIPYEITDVAERHANPMLVALDWILRLPQQRCLQSEVRDLLDVPAIAARFGIAEGELPRLAQWIEGSGVRWGLDHEHRQGLGLGSVGEQNSWIFGIRRMLLGYASGSGGAYAGIEPYGEVGGLDACLAGSLATFVSALLRWRAILADEATPASWGRHARALLEEFFQPGDERTRLMLARLHQALQKWLDDCECAQFDDAVPVGILREAWLDQLDDQSLNQRFISGGVTFCTLMPMRAVPFRVVCLLGMNDGDFPRRAGRADFDLLAVPAMARPGDRSRRDDDRYLMLEAILAARQKLYISWVGRNIRDNTHQPPSVLVSQLRDYLATGWKADLCAMTTEHFLQPFSRGYFEQGGLATHALEWRAAHAAPATGSPPEEPTLATESGCRLQLPELARFVKQPVKAFFRQRLHVVFDEQSAVCQNDEPFAFDSLQEYEIAGLLMEDDGPLEEEEQAGHVLRERAARLGRQGLLSVGLSGTVVEQYLVDELTPVRQAWLRLNRRFAARADKIRVACVDGDTVLEDWIGQLRTDGSNTAWLAQDPGRIVTKMKDKVQARPHKLIECWIRQLAGAAAGQSVTGFLVGRDAVVVMAPVDPEDARATLATILQCWRDGMARPLPVACRTALALLAGDDPCKQYDGGYDNKPPAEVKSERCLARLWPDFSLLSAEQEWEPLSRRLYGPLHEWACTKVQVVAHDQLFVEKEEA